MRGRGDARDDAVALSYGLGRRLLRTRYGPACFKEGEDAGWVNHMIAFDRPKTAVVVMMNSSNGPRIVARLTAELIADTFTPAEWDGYTPPPPPRRAADVRS